MTDPKDVTEWMEDLEPHPYKAAAGPPPLATCAGCLSQMGLTEYLSNDYYCDPCADKAEAFPLQTTHQPKEDR